MTQKTLFFVGMAIMLCISAYSRAQQWSGILKPLTTNQKNVSQSAIDWSTAGVTGGIPSGSWTQCGATIQATTFGNGTTDATAAINAAIAACGSNQYVLLGPGTFLINSAGAGSPPVRLNKNNVALRGSGASQTVLNSTGTNGNGIIMLGTGSDPTPGNAVGIASGATAGSQTIVLASASSNFAVGKDMIIHELNDSNYVTITGASDSCTYCDGLWSGTRARGQIVEITSVNGTTIGFTPPLYTAYTLSPESVPFPVIKYAGLENLQIYSNGTHPSGNDNATVEFYSCSDCWAKGVEVNYTDGDYVKIYWGLHNEVRDSYFSNAFSHGPGSNNGAVTLGYKATANKIENNIMERPENPVMVVRGAAGNVISYNYATGAFGQPWTISVPMEGHSAHVQFNLFEGNVANGLWFDVGHGSSSQSTTFRNWWIGTGRACTPANDGVGGLTTRGTVNCSGTSGIWEADAARAVQDDSIDTYDNFVGDVVSSPAQMALTGTHTALLLWPTNRAYNGASYGFTFGYSLLGDPGNTPMDNTNPYTRSFIHGVYSYINGSTTWASGVAQGLPASFYLASKPAWWGNLPFPAIGPDVTGGVVPVGLQGSSPGGHANMIPAMSCFYNVMAGVDGGAGGPRTFNPASCYTSTSSTGSVSAPTGLTNIVH